MAPRASTIDALGPEQTVNELAYRPGKGMRPRDENERLKRQPIDWIIAPVLVMSPILAIVGACFVPLRTPTLIWAIAMYLFTGLGITAGYHRLWAHKAYDATLPVRIFLAVFGAAAMEGSCRWWSRNHRAHHKFTDTPKDPYNVTRSFFWAHIGWMLYKQDKREVGPADISDLDADPVMMWQHRNYPMLVLLFSIVFPIAVAWVGWGDPWGALVYAVFGRLVFVHHSTFFVNSLAHYLGVQPYSDLHSAFDSVVTALVSLGEGYHNYHHEFPQDYRNGIKWYHFDPTKWFITLLYRLGLVYNLRWVEENEVEKAKLQMKQAKLDRIRNELAYGKDFANLPEYTAGRFRAELAAGRMLTVVGGLVVDVADYLDGHPGGRQTLRKAIGTDATPLFRGQTGEHVHSLFAARTLKRMVVGRLSESLDAAPAS